MKEKMLMLLPFFCESPPKEHVFIFKNCLLYICLWYTALITYVNVILNQNLYRGEFNAARCLQVQVQGGGAPIDRVCLLQGRAEVHHTASPPSGRFRYVSSVWIRWSSFLVKCQEKNTGRCCLLCLQEGSVWFVRDFFHP